MLQRQHGAPAFLVIGKNGAGGIEGRRRRQAGRAQIVSPSNATAKAVRNRRSPDHREMRFRSSTAAQNPACATWRATADAERWKQQIQNRFGDIAIPAIVII